MKEIIRTCVVCRQPKDKRELIRFVKKADGKIEFDETGKASGRGAYICRNAACITKASKNRGLERSLKARVPEDVLERIIKELDAAKT